LSPSLLNEGGLHCMYNKTSNGGYPSPGGYPGYMGGTGPAAGGFPGMMPNAGYPGMPTGVGGVTGTMPGMMPNAGYPGMPTGVGGTGTMPGAMPNAGYPGMPTGVGGVMGTMPGAMPNAGYPGMPTGVGGVMGTMPGAVPPPVPSGLPILPGGTTLPGSTGQEESYVENILRMNLGKVATIYMTFENNCEWNAKVFKGVLEAAGRDHIIISDPTSGKRYLLLTVNLDYITFDEPLVYTLPFGSSPSMGAMGLYRPQ
jgi:spore germination protein Q